jgi:hypothetical protein
LDTESRGDGWVLFAGVMIMIAGFLNAVYGIAGIGNSSAFVGGSHYVIFDSLNAWGWIHLLIGIVQLFAAFSIWNRSPFGRVIGVGSASISAVAILFFSNAFPFVAFGIFIIDLLVIYGLVAYGGRATVSSRPRANA